MMRNPWFAGLAALLLSTSAVAANRPSGYTTICKEGAACSVASSTNVAFGRANTFIYKVLVGQFACNASTFGSRVAGGVNECSVPSAGASSSIASSSAASSLAASSKAASSTAASSSSKASSAAASSVAASSVAASSIAASSSSSVSSASSSVATGAQCTPYQWPAYSPDLNYDIKNDTTLPKVDPATLKVYQGCNASTIAGVKTKGRFAFIWGKNRNPSITDADIDRVLTNLNTDADYLRDVMGWPIDKMQRDGYFTNIYLYGSGLCTDSAANTEKGGWQSNLNGYPMLLLSYYPIVTPSERGGITHEYIHVLMKAFPDKAAWFNEGGNTYLQMTMEANRTGTYGVGFLDATSFLAPHMPIENYSGWLQDGTFGGPNAEGVDLQVNGKQVATWREYLGGNQYNAGFALFLSVNLSKGANPWIWRNGPYEHIVRSLSSGLGDAQTKRLITEFRARQAMVDFGAWTNALKVPINDNWGRTISSEKTDGGLLKETSHRLSFYAATTQSGTTLIPATETLPGWTGANQIPLKVSGNKVRVNFQPLGNNMRFQLAYRAADGSAVYSQPVDSGEACLDLTKAPKNGVVVGVATNLDYVYNGEVTRKAKYDYRVHLLEGVTGTAPLYDKYYQ